jgi:hypothetical protein
VIYEHGETWWNVIDRDKLIRPQELSGNPTYLVAKQEELSKEMMNLALRRSYLKGFFNMLQHFTTWSRNAANFSLSLPGLNP